MIKNLHAKSYVAVLTLIFMAISSLFSQTTIWSDNFDAPSGGANNNNAGVGWTLNTEGNSGNRWFINTPEGIGCSSTGNVLHISCTGILCGFLGGPNEPIYSASNNLTRTAISPSISTVGQSNLTLTFEFICEGSAGTDFGTLSLSGDGGTSWNDLPGEYSAVSSCSTKTITIPANYENITSLKLRFKWQESDAADGFDPPFSVDNIRITTPSTACIAPTVNAGTASAICSGASVNIGGSPTATGGSGNGTYTYAWTPSTGLSSATVANPSANPTTTTTYNLVVTQGGAVCTGSGSVTVTVDNPQTLTTNPSGIQNLCAGQSLPITASAGFTNYSWTSPGGVLNGQTITADLAGDFQVSATDANGCLSTAPAVTLNYSTGGGNITITPPGPIASCEGQSVVLTAQSGLTNYIWSNGATGNTLNVSETGGYSVSAQDANGCTLVSGIVDIELNSLPVANFTFEQTFTTEYQVQFTNTSSSADAYLWNFGGNNTSIEQSPLFTFAFDNNWPVTLTVTNNCGTSTTTITVNVIKTSINDLPGFNSVNVGPNPGNDFLIFSGVTHSNKKVNFKIYDLLGKLQLQKQVQVQGNFNEILNTESLSKGMYLIEVESDKVVATQKWIKN
jgi:PKD repeat protein